MSSEEADQKMSQLSLTEAKNDLQHPYSMQGRVVIKTLLSKGPEMFGQSVVVGGWVKTGRIQGKGAFCFLQINDGSTQKNLQCVVQQEVHDVSQLASTGTCVLFRGEVKEPPEGSKEPLEISVTEVLHLGPSDAKSYPVSKTKLSVEFLRSVIHFRPRTNLISAVTRIRNALAAATHKFFQEQGFLYINTPLITSSDCEGAGEMFSVTTMLSQAEENLKQPPPTAEELEEAQSSVQEQADLVRTMKEEKADKKKIKSAVSELQSRKTILATLEAKQRSIGGLPLTEDRQIDYSKDFFSRPAYLTVSGQLEAEIYACALTSVYTFGPTFRAENSHTTRHLAEFWMIEPEIAFCDFDGVMTCASDYVRYCCQYVLEQCSDEIDFITQRVDKTARKRLELTASTPVKRISYTDACALLSSHAEEGKVKFEEPVEWGIDLGTEHERYLSEKVFQGPVIVHDYPKHFKAFYMRLNDDDNTVAAMDLLVPGVGELIGGSQREERLDVLQNRIKEAGLDEETYSWYLDLRRYGSVPHAGFGLGFERLVLFATGVENIREVIPFPRYPGHIL